MDLRTSNIIMICKGCHPYGSIASIDAIRKYMSEMCGTEESDYNDAILLDIIKNVVLDYIKSSDDAHNLLFDYFECLRRNNDNSLQAWISALMLTDVRRYNTATDKFEYVNGFNESNTVLIDETTNKILYPV